MPIDPTELMRLAIDNARAGIATGQTPFGCAIARDDDLLAVAHNTVWATTDITAHAEVNAIRQACRNTGQVLLTSSVVATTCEPCPMCMAALHWARVDTVYFGATVGDAKAAGFNELQVPASEIIRLGGGNVKLVPGLLADECTALFAEWRGSKDRREY